MTFRVTEQRKRIYSVDCGGVVTRDLPLQDLIQLSQEIVGQKPQLKELILQAMRFVIAVDRM